MAFSLNKNADLMSGQSKTNKIISILLSSAYAFYDAHVKNSPQL
ncbi:hypothetical protein VCRA2126O85_50129 [Vibrio crassostreae]|nr:hypothetical protein VCRA2113O324_20043 [Vibrio crassostreae]CAK2116238.1 hypothetical protein VCRA2111O320_30400 [Vibrio crassostreae]CAK2971528.1 hypothetical protein VCRA2121O336_30402 [Vibrio crassostreae]CAK3034591.1 hypothetical protein VCRA2125O83_50129 [Vibrio crassostreae]CAK3035034.1 hypothetical protein VCRA2128O106_50129 [Vibrio crassostreae]